MRKMQSKSHVKIISFILIALLVISSIPFVIPVKAAGQLSSAKDTIGTSQAGVVSSHSFVFTPVNTTSIKTIDFQYCTTASGTCTAPTGMVLTAAPQLGTVSGIDGTGYTSSATNTNCTGAGNTDCTITLTVGTPSTQTLTPINVPFLSGVTNPTTTNTSFYVRVTTKDAGTTAIDAAVTAFATLTATSMAVTAQVDPTFSFSLAAVTSGSVNGQAVNVTTGTSASTIPFSNVSAGTPKVAAHDITVTSNAIGGYVVTASASANPPLTDGGSNNIDYYTGTNATPTTWSGDPGGSSPNVNTGLFGYTTEDATLTGGTVDRFTNGGPKWAGMITTPDPVVSSTSQVTSEVTRVGWKVAVNALQPAGAYTGTVILVATPTY